MGVLSKPGHAETLDGELRPLRLTNAEIERFEVEHRTGIFGLFDALMGRGDPPQLRHVRDIVALGLVGGGMSERRADALMARLGPDQALHLRAVAARLIGVTFLPAVAEAAAAEKKSPGGRRRASQPPVPTPGAPEPV